MGRLIRSLSDCQLEVKEKKTMGVKRWPLSGLLLALCFIKMTMSQMDAQDGEGNDDDDDGDENPIYNDPDREDYGAFFPEKGEPRRSRDIESGFILDQDLRLVRT